MTPHRQTHRASFFVTSAALAALLLVAAAHAQQGLRVRVEDGDFNLANWELTTVANDAGIRVETERRSGGGTPGAFRIVTHRMPRAIPGREFPQVVSLHRYLRATYVPAEDGAIRAICYSEDVFVVQGFGQGQNTGLVVWQSGRVYGASLGPTYVPSRWKRLGPRIVAAEDFHEILPGATRDPDAHPDFSAAGGEIALGFMRSNTSTTGGYVLMGAIDNWSVEINCAAGGPSPTATRTNTPVPTRILRPSATPTATGTLPAPTRTPTMPVPGTPTITPGPIFLPLWLRERCPPADLYADIALVLDASTTMHERTRSGRRQIDVAVAATRELLAGLRLRPGGDRLGLVTFNATAVTLAPLTHDRTRLENALARIEIRQQSRIDLGLRAASRTLEDARPHTVRALILLSDGRTNPSPESEVLEAAASARAAGITLYVVGLGPQQDRSLLNAVADNPARYLSAEDPDVLGALYAELARRVPCPPHAYWGRR